MFPQSEVNSGWSFQTDSSEGFVCEKDSESGKVQVLPHHRSFDLLRGGFLPAFSLLGIWIYPALIRNVQFLFN